MQKKRSFLYIFLTFLILSIIILLIFKVPFFKPVSAGIQSIFSPIQTLFYNFSFGFSKNSEISNLKKQNLELSKKLVDQSKIIADNKALRDQFATEYPRQSDLLPANIISAPSFIPGVTLPESYILDKGQKDGVKIGQAVVYQDNIVGKIIEVSDYFSKVTLITNSNFSATAQTLSNQAQGIAKGQGGDEIILDNVILSQELKIDDLVVTKGDINDKGIRILPSLTIGKIISVNKNPSDLFQIAKIKSSLDFSRLSKVFIFTGI